MEKEILNRKKNTSKSVPKADKGKLHKIDFSSSEIKESPVGNRYMYLNDILNQIKQPHDNIILKTKGVRQKKIYKNNRKTTLQSLQNNKKI